MRALSQCGALLALALAPGCASDSPPELRTDLFVEACAALSACECSEPLYVDQAHCRDVLAADLAGLEAAARAAGLIFEAICADTDLPVVRFECRSERELLVDAPPCRPCAVVHGDVPLGAPCLDYGDFSDCAQGLACDPDRHVCVDLCALPVDTPCTADNRRCADGLICDILEKRTCAEAPGQGEPCVSYRCQEPLVCTPIGENNWECREFPGLGEACVDGCSEGNCSGDGDARKCVKLAGLGEACPAFSFSFCDKDLWCNLQTNQCERTPGLGESCATTPCASMWECVDDVCTRGPARVCEE